MSEKILKKDDEKETSLEAHKTSNRNALLWYSYDMADTFFSQTVISLAFTPYAMLLGAIQGWTYVNTFLIVSIFMASSNLLVAIFSPILGSISDTTGKRKPAVIIVASIMVVTTALMAAWKNFWWICFLFIIANFCYQAGRMFYDSQIPFIAETGKRSMIQAVGGGLAAFGSLIGIGLGLLISSLTIPWDSVNTNIWELGEAGYGTANIGGLPWLCLAAAGVIVILSIPYLFHKEVENPTELTPKENLKHSMKNLIVSLRAIFKDKNAILFFLGWFFLVDAANTTILYMVPIVEGAVGISTQLETYAIIATGIILSIIFGIITGYILKRFGPKLTFIFSGIGWSMALIFAILAGLQYKTEIIENVTIIHTLPTWIMYAGAFCIGVGFGSIWIIGRQFIMVLAPPSRLAQYNGVQKIAGRVSAIVSPLIFSGIMILAKQYTIINHAFRYALGSVLAFFFIGMLLIAFIRDPYKRYNAGERAPYLGIYDKKHKS
ncbi:MAG: MFS transporter [Candidatus Heimdallarchaeota archaeon]|nr:MFS transporter [Candidatus Heimdallarchaeota archaeon]